MCVSYANDPPLVAPVTPRPLGDEIEIVLLSPAAMITSARDGYFEFAEAISDPFPGMPEIVEHDFKPCSKSTLWDGPGGRFSSPINRSQALLQHARWRPAAAESEPAPIMPVLRAPDGRRLADYWFQQRLSHPLGTPTAPRGPSDVLDLVGGDVNTSHTLSRSCR
jgi:hypothetical protein